MVMKPLIYSAKLSSQTVKTKAKITVTVAVEDVETYYAEPKYARSSDYELIAGQEIGVI